MTAVDTLILAIGTDTNLQTLKTDVQTFSTQLHRAYDAQKGAISEKDEGSDEVEQARIEYCIALYGVLGLLIDHFKETPEMVGNYFDLETIRNHDQQIFRHDINGGETLLAITHTFGENEKIKKLINRMNTDLKIALVEDKNAPVPANAYTLAANSTAEEIDPATLGIEDF